MWEQLNKEAQDLKVKIETHKRENRRLTTAIEQHKSDAARLTTRLQKSEKLREEAIDALMLQQELAETLEREREKNLKEIAQLKHLNKNVTRQKEEAQRVVVHLRSLITGQTRHMEHIVGSIYRPPSPAVTPTKETIHESPVVDEKSDDSDETKATVSERASSRQSTSQRLSTIKSAASLRRLSRRGEHERPVYENRVFNSPTGTRSKRLSEVSLLDVADRHLRDKTDAIANIIRNISDQCAAAVEALQLARDADDKEPEEELSSAQVSGTATSETSDQSGEASSSSELGFEDTGSSVSKTSKHSSIPPTPDLVRSSTALSMNSLTTTDPRSSQQYLYMSPRIQPKIVEGDEGSEVGSALGMAPVHKIIERERTALATHRPTAQP